MSNQYGIKEVLNLSFQDLSTGDPLLYIDYAESTEIDNAATRIDLTGGQGNYRLLSFDHTKLATMKLKVPLVDTTLLSMLMGDSVATGAQNVIKREILTVSSGTATLSSTPVAGTTTSVFYLQGSRDNGTPLTVAASTPTTGQYSISGAVLTLNSSDNGKEIVVWYTYATPSTTTSFNMKANKFVTAMTVTGYGLARDQVSGVDKAAVFQIYNARFKPNFNLTMSSTAATSLDMEMDMYTKNINGDQVYYTVNFLT